MRTHHLLIVAGLALALGTPASAFAAAVALNWTAPGDDSLSGPAVAYDLRYATWPITSSSFSSAVQAQGEPAPAPPGTRQSLIISGLAPNATYYFALKTLDDAGNWSPISNVAAKTMSALVDVAPSAPVLGFSPPRPNPAASRSTFVLSLPAAAEAEIAVFDPGGRRIRTLLAGRQSAGETRVEWDLRDDHGARVATGFYLVRARLANATFVRSVVVAR